MFGLIGTANYNGAIVSEISAPEVARPKSFIQRDVKSHEIGDDIMESKFSNMNLMNSDVSDDFVSDKDTQQV